MGQKHSKEESKEELEEPTKIISTPHMRSKKPSRANPSAFQTISGRESTRNIDALLSQMGIHTSLDRDVKSGCFVIRWLLVDESSDSEEIVIPKDDSQLRERVQELYDKRMNRYKARLSALYPEHSQAGNVDISRFRTATMSELVSYLDTTTQMRLKSVNHYFHKLIMISHYDVSLSARTGWVDVINLSSFLRRIRLYGEPKEHDLHQFTTMIQNDNFTELSSLEFHHIGEWALLEILEALSRHVQRAVALGILSSSVQIELIIQESDFTPFFAKRFADVINNSLYHILFSIRFITKSVEGLELLLKNTNFSVCTHLTRVNFNAVSLARHGFELFLHSLLGDTSVTSVPRLTHLLLANTTLTDPCVVLLMDPATAGLLSNLNTLDLSSNRLTGAAVDVLTSITRQFLLPNLECLALSDNCDCGHGFIAPFALALAEGVCPLLNSLALNHCGLNTTDMDALTVFLASPYAENLRLLDIGNNRGMLGSLPQFFQCLACAPALRLQSLNLEGVGIHPDVLPQLKDFLASPAIAALRCLYINNNQLDAKCFLALLRGLVGAHDLELTILDVSSNCIGDFDTVSWEKFVYARQARHTRHAWHGKYGKHGMHCKQDQQEAQGQSSIIIHQLNFSHNPLTNEDLALIACFYERFTQISLLNEVDFEDNKISARGIGTFLNCFPREVPSALNKLSVVSLSLRCVGEVLHNWLCSPAASNLKKLILTNCNLCKMDLTYLINAFEISQYTNHLQLLRLSGNYEIDDDFIKDFIRIYSVEGLLPFIYELDVSYTNVSKVGAYALLEFFDTHQYYSLRRVNLVYTKISDHRANILFNEFKKRFKGGCML